MKIALLQLEVLEKNKEANVAHGLQLAAEAAKKHDLLVLPEVWTTGYSLDTWSRSRKHRLRLCWRSLLKLHVMSSALFSQARCLCVMPMARFTIPLRLSIKTVKSSIFMIRCIFLAFSMKRISLLPAIIFQAFTLRWSVLRLDYLLRFAFFLSFSVIWLCREHSSFSARLNG